MKMLSIACKITGDDYQILSSDTPSSRKKVMALGIAVIVPTIMWFITGFTMVHVVFDKSFLSGIIAGSLAATIIFIIEKLVVMSNGNTWLVLFRVLLAFLVAVLGSVFLDEAIFIKDINQQMVINRDKMVAEKEKEVLLSNDAEFTAREKDVQAKYVAWQESLKAAASEADGSSGSGIKGVHAITKLKLASAETNQIDYLQANKELEVLRSQIKADQAKAATNVNENFDNGALLQRIKAMFDLVKTDRYMMKFYVLITAILFVLEFLVVIFKLTIGKTNYDRRLELIEEIGRKRMDRIRNNDHAHFEQARVYPNYKQASATLQQSRSASMFN